MKVFYQKDKMHILSDRWRGETTTIFYIFFKEFSYIIYNNSLL